MEAPHALAAQSVQLSTRRRRCACHDPQECRHGVAAWLMRAGRMVFIERVLLESFVTLAVRGLLVIV